MKVPLRFKTADRIDHVFRTCCALHNILLRHDGLGSIGQFPSDWKTLDPEQVRKAQGVGGAWVSE